METLDTSSKTIDRSTLARLTDAEGAWKENIVQALPADRWARWFKNRIEGDDPYFSYGRNEYPKGANDLFFNCFRKLPDLDTEPAAEGLAIYLRYFRWCHTSDDLDVPRSVHVQQALELLLTVRARNTRARPELRDVLRDFIDNALLLSRTQNDDLYAVSPTDLHRKALIALSVLQVREDTSDWDIWRVHRTEHHFAETYDATYDPRFTLTAFSGLALSAPSPAELPEGMVVDLLNLVDDNGRTLHPRHSVEALFIGRSDQRRELFTYLWEEVHRRGRDPENDWSRLKSLLGRVATLPPYRRMKVLHDRQSTGEGFLASVHHSPTSSWEEDADLGRREDHYHLRISELLSGNGDETNALTHQSIGPSWRENFTESRDLIPTG
jgi:hypothetical protein